MSRPDKIPGLKLWWDADDTSTINDGRILPGEQIRTWVDKVGGYKLSSRADALSTNWAATYSTGFINGRNSIYFGYYVGADNNDLGIKRLTCPLVPPLESGTFSIFLVYRPTSFAEGRIRPNGTKVTSGGSSNPSGWGFNGTYENTNAGGYMHMLGIYRRTTYQSLGSLSNFLPERSIQLQFSAANNLGMFKESPLNVFVSQYGTADPFKEIKETGDLYAQQRSTGKYLQNSKVNIISTRSGNNSLGSGFRTGTAIRSDFTFRDSSIRWSSGAITNTSPQATSSLLGQVVNIQNPILVIGALWPGPVTLENGTNITTAEPTRTRTAQWGYSPYEGHFCEFIFYDRVLSDVETGVVNDYLKRKWIG